MSRLPFEIFLALRYFRPKGTYVSVMTLIAAVGVMLAVGMLIIVIAVMTGFDHDLRERILGFNAHLKVFAQGTTLHNSEQVHKVVAAHPDVRGAAPFVFGQVLVETQPATGNATVGAPWVRGIDPQNESTVTVLPKSVVAGKFNKVIADELNISMRTVEVHRANLFDKMQVKTAVELANLLKTGG